ncbi:hypothetical protein ACUXD4_001916 [Staphylococcus lugdunensis]
MYKNKNKIYVSANENFNLNSARHDKMLLNQILVLDMLEVKQALIFVHMALNIGKW